jgi:predicted nucleic acid-binding Zn ribbon protein
MQKRSGEISAIGDALKRMLHDQELEEPIRTHTAPVVWAEIVGAEIAAATTAEAVRGEVLFVRVKSNVWANELTFLKQDILDRLNRRLGGKTLSDIRFKISGRALKPRATPPIRSEGPDGKTLGRIAPTGPLAEYARRRTGISDPEADRRLREALTKVAQTQAWKREHGWIPCASCAALFPSKTEAGIESRFCPFCMSLRDV